WVMPADGGAARQLTHTRGGSGFADWAGNDQILFVHRDPTFTRGCLAAVPARGGEPRCITSESADLYNPAVSPDGRTVAFGATRDGVPRIYLTDLHAAGKKQAIAKGGGGVARWSPDGQTIYFLGAGARNGNLW